MLPSESYKECQSPEFQQPYSPIHFQRTSSFENHENKVILIDKFKIKLRHTATNNYEETKGEKPEKKAKKQLKLITNPKLEEDMEKSKSFSPQPLTKSSIKIPSNFFSFLPTRPFKRGGSLLTNEEFHYFEDFFDVTCRKGSLKHQQDKVPLFFNYKTLKNPLK